MFNQENSKKQGDVGLGIAIGWFVYHNYTVSIPLTDSQDYDLLVDRENKISKVQVRTCSYIKNNSYDVQLSVKGGNRSGRGKIKLFDKTKVDLLFVVTSDQRNFLIPSNNIMSKSHWSLNPSRVAKFQVYMV